MARLRASRPASTSPRNTATAQACFIWLPNRTRAQRKPRLRAVWVVQVVGHGLVREIILVGHRIRFSTARRATKGTGIRLAMTPVRAASPRVDCAKPGIDVSTMPGRLALERPPRLVGRPAHRPFSLFVSGIAAISPRYWQSRFCPFYVLIFCAPRRLWQRFWGPRIAQRSLT
jgi:hypothetical protein